MWRTFISKKGLSRLFAHHVVFSSAASWRSRCDVIPVRETRIKGLGREMRRFAGCAGDGIFCWDQTRRIVRTVAGRAKLSSGPSTGRKRQKTKTDPNNRRRASCELSRPLPLALIQSPRAWARPSGQGAPQRSWSRCGHHKTFNVGTRLTVRSAR